MIEPDLSDARQFVAHVNQAHGFDEGEHVVYSGPSEPTIRYHRFLHEEVGGQSHAHADYGIDG